MTLCLGVARHLLVPFFFMTLHPYIPLHFMEMIVPLVTLIVPKLAGRMCECLSVIAC